MQSAVPEVADAAGLRERLGRQCAVAFPPSVEKPLNILAMRGLAVGLFDL
jgi:hypothetical protein